MDNEKLKGEVVRLNDHGTQLQGDQKVLPI